MHQTSANDAKARLSRIGRELIEMPAVSLWTRPLCQRRFERLFQEDTQYFGVYSSFDEARAAVPANAPATYDTDAAARMYHSLLQETRLCDYPAIHWLGRLFAQGQSKVFDLGGHIGLAYYAFRRHLSYPADLDWCVHDVPQVMDAGTAWAATHDPERRLRFSARPEAADGADVLFTSGALQYLDYTLAELIERLTAPPTHVLVNLVPMHPHEGFFTLQNIGIAICPYRVIGLPEFLDSMAQVGYSVVDRWDITDRNLHVPFHPEHDIDRYYGFYMKRETRRTS